MDPEIDAQIAEDDTPLGEALPVAEMPDEFGDLSDMNNFDFLGDEERDPDDAETPPTVDAPEEAPEPAAAEQVAEPQSADPLAAEKLAAYERLDTALRENPGQAIRAIFTGMPATERAALVAELAGPAAAAPQASEDFDVMEYEPQGEMEQALASRWDRIEAIPSIMAAQDSMTRSMEQGFSAFVPHVTDANIASQVALAKIEAICDALGLNLPDPDGEAVIKNLQTGKTTYRDAVRQSTNYKGQVDAHKQTRRPRPETPGGGPRNIEKIAAGTDAVAIARRLGILPPR